MTIRMVERGCSRMVLLVGPYAFKFPSARYGWRQFLNGLIHNMNERAIWRGTRDSRLCPILFSIRGGWLVVMKRAEMLSEANLAQIDLNLWARSLDESCVASVEPKPDSFGWLGHTLVAVDYGDR